VGVWGEEDVRGLRSSARRYEPRMGDDERAALLGAWRRAVERSRGWAAA
jgi:glycerol kinase